jgi:hypothetical protein
VLSTSNFANQFHNLSENQESRINLLEKFDGIQSKF